MARSVSFSHLKNGRQGSVPNSVCHNIQASYVWENGSLDNEEALVEYSLDATTGQVELAIRDALLAQAKIYSGDDNWNLNDIYQVQVRRG